MNSTHTTLKRRLIPSILALVGYGAWAFFANHEYVVSTALKAAVTQGTISFTLTLSINVFIEWLLKQFSAVKVKVFLVGMTASLCLIVVSYTINWLAKTPNILMTIFPGSVIGSVYATSYAFLCKRQSLERAK